MNKQNKAKKFVIFYSWQSDLPENTNKKFIAKALEKSKSILNKRAKELGIGKEIVEIDRDTKNTTGMPDIGNTILEKIRHCNVFIGDVSLIGSITPLKEIELKEPKRLTPNPNVLIELGYAAGLPHIGYDRIISLMNTYFGEPESLPFDIRVKRVAKYSISPEDNEEKITEKREELAKNLAEYISPFLEKDQGSLLGSDELTTSIEFRPSSENCDAEGRLIIPTFNYEKIAELIEHIEKKYIFPSEDMSLLNEEQTDYFIRHNFAVENFIKEIKVTTYPFHTNIMGRIKNKSLKPINTFNPCFRKVEIIACRRA